MCKRNKTKSTIAITQIVLMVIAIFAFAFMINIQSVSAIDPEGGSQDICDSKGGICLFSPCSSYGISSVSPNDCGSGKYCCNKIDYDIYQQEKEIFEEGDQEIWNEEESPEPEGKGIPEGKTPVPTDKKEEGSSSRLKKIFGEEASRRLQEEISKKVEEYIKNRDSENNLPEEESSSLLGNLGDLGKDIFKGYFRGYTSPVYQKNMLVEGSKYEKEALDWALDKAKKKLGQDAAADKLKTETAKQLSKSTISQTAVYVNSFAWAMTGAKIYLQAIKLFGAGERNVRTIQKSQIASVPLGTIAGIAAVGAGIPGPGWIAAGVSAAVMGVWTAFTHQDYSREVFVYDVQGWQPPIGGEHCQECNDLRYGCSEYQCHTFGTACELINVGTEEEVCVWANKDDMNPPEISQLDILDKGFSYSPSKGITYPNRGVDLLYNDGCIDPFTSVKFGVKTSEPAQCKIDLDRNHFENMSSHMNEGSSFTENHTIEIPASAIPSASALEGVGWSIDAGKDYSFYISCRDYNGNLAPYHFVMSFCVDDGPDTSPPIIFGTNYETGEFIKSGKKSLSDFEVYTNEPAECKWDFNDMSYDSMGYEFSECSKEIGDYLFEDTLTYGCRGTIDGLKDREENTFYIRCKDKPWLTGNETEKEMRVANEESYKLSLIGTDKLGIESISVNGLESGAVIRDSTNNIKATLSVKTFGGAEEGLARCTYKGSNDPLYYDFQSEEGEEYNYISEHDLRLGEGNYLYYLKCFDRGGNVAEGNISFTIDTDTEPPIVARAYYKNNKIVLVTNENATCVYNTNSPNQAYEDSIQITTSNNIEHYLPWDTEQDLYIQCEDSYGIRPDSGDPSIIIRGHEIYSIAESDEE